MSEQLSRTNYFHNGVVTIHTVPAKTMTYNSQEFMLHMFPSNGSRWAMLWVSEVELRELKDLIEAILHNVKKGSEI